MGNIYDWAKKELNESNEIKLYKVTGKEGNYFYIKVIDHPNPRSIYSKELCMPIIPKRYYEHCEDKDRWEWYFNNYDPIVSLDSSAHYWSVIILDDRLNVSMTDPQIEYLGIYTQEKLAKLY